MSTLRLTPAEFRAVRKVAQALGCTTAEDAAAMLKAGEIRAVLAENVTVVAPGETLVIRVSDLTLSQMREYQRSFSEHYDAGDIPFRCIVVHGDELGKVATG